MTGRPRLRILFLLLASYFFYASNNGWILSLLLASTAVDYFAALKIENVVGPRAKKTWLILSMIANLGMLGFFKYYNFFAESFIAAGFPARTLDIILPVGISFYTFQSMSYTIDVYRGRLKAEKSFLNFAFYVAFFPQLVAGPIVRAKYFLHQVPEKPRLNLRMLEGSLYLVFTGLFKKIVLGDTLGDFAGAAFDDPGSIGAVTAWLGLYAFTFQIYFDFSGYTDIAIGCARLLGYRLPPNFRRPYTAASFSEFWRRWHISLSYWLRDYLYIPLGGGRGSKIFNMRNLMITMLLGGLWHGAAWNFVIWGGIHGLMLAGERAFGMVHMARDFAGRAWVRFIHSFIVFQIVVLTWAPFRATGLENLTDFARSLIRFDHPAVITYGMVIAAMICAGGYGAQWIGERWSLRRFAVRQPVVMKALFYAGITICVVVFSARGSEPFIYFRF